MRLNARIALLTAVLATGCGTTVSGITAAQSDAAGQAGGLSAPSPNASLPGSAVAGVSGGTVSGGAAGSGVIPGPGGTSATGTTTGSAAGGTTTGGSSSGGSSMGPGVTADKVYVGLVWPKNQDAVNSAAGAGGISVGDPKADAQAVIDDINKHGGVAGRQLTPVFQPVDSTSAQTQDSQFAAACDHFTNDQRVFAVVGSGPASYQACLAKAGIVQLDEDLPSIGDSEFTQNPALVELGYPKLSRIAKAQLDALAHQNYFSPWNTRTGGPAPAGKAKVGILTIDDPGYAAVVDNILIPGLKQLGYDPSADVARIAPTANAADISNQAAANQSAELKFASDGVTHVVVFEANGGNSLLFMNQAESQHYRPRYGVNSGSGLQTLVDAGDVQPGQAVGAVGFGWIPAYDLPARMNPDNGRYSNAERRHCLALFKRHGITFSNPNAEYTGFAYCAPLDLLQTVLDRTTNSLTVAGFVNVLNGLGSTYQAPATPGTYLSATQHDGVSKGYYWSYFADCKCLHYTGALRTIPS